ncbi:MAG: prolyl oligopeptidase family serine peptidase, partial [Saprospiraceae bacterium]|nr:prolyl oligopeptidase family serine peptidase [Saprospiraceae bacterium]
GYSDVYNTRLSESIEIDYLIDVYGPVDLKKLYQDRHPVVDKLRSAGDKLPESVRDVFNLNHWLFGFNPAERPKEAEAFATIYSPVSYLREGLPPTLIIHGMKDRLVPVSQSHNLKSALDSVGIISSSYILDGVDHGFFFATKEEKEEVQQRIVEFVMQH